MSGLVPQPFSHDPSATAAFAALPDAMQSELVREPMRAVVIGGGTGAPVSIRTLLSMGVSTDAVVAMADDGGSTGILRDQAGATAPGDIRKCITAMAGDPDDPLTKAFKVRFGFAENHTLGNLMLSALEVTSGGFPEAIGICERLLGARGHVHPSTLGRVTLAAKTRDGRLVEGQAVANHSRTALRRVALHSDQPIVAYGPALEAIRAADLIVLGPGSLFTSIIPNLLVPGIVEAIREADAKVVFVCSLADMQGETRGMSAVEHLRALNEHGMEGLVDFVLVHDTQAQAASKGSGLADAVPGVEGTPGADGASATGEDGHEDDDQVRRGVSVDEDELRAEAGYGRVIIADLVDDEHPTWHDPSKLRHAFADVLNTRF